MWRIRDLHIRGERSTSWNSFLIRLWGTIWASEQTDWPARLWALPCFFSPCQAQCGPSLSSGEKWGWACCCDITSWFWNTRKRWKTLRKATGQATRHHTATLIFSFPATLKAQTFSYFYHKKEKIIFVTESINSGMCYFINTPLSHYPTEATEVNIGKMSIQQVSYVKFTRWLGNVWTHLLCTHPASGGDHQV